MIMSLLVTILLFALTTAVKPEIGNSHNALSLYVLVEKCNFSFVGKHVNHLSLNGNYSSKYVFKEIECGYSFSSFDMELFNSWHHPLLIVGSSATIDFVTSTLAFYNLPKIDSINFFDFFLLLQNNKNLILHLMCELLSQWSWESNHLYIDDYYLNSIQPNIMHLRNVTGLMGNFSPITTHIAQKLPPSSFVDYLKTNLEQKSIFVLSNANVTHQLVSLASTAKLFSGEVKWFIFYNEYLNSLENILDLQTESHLFIIRHTGRIRNLNDLLEEYVKLSLKRMSAERNLMPEVEIIPHLMNQVKLEVVSLNAAPEDSSTMSIQHIARWSPSSGLDMKATSRFSNFHKKLITIATAENPPYVFVKKSLTPMGGLFVSGYLIDVMNILASILNFTAVYRDGHSINKSTNGVIDLLIKQEADIGVHGLIVTADYTQLVDFSSVALDTQSMAGLYQRPSAEGDDLQKFGVYLEPFATQVWVASAITLFMLISTFFLSSWVNRYLANLKQKFHLDPSRTILLGIQAVAQQGCELEVHHSSGRMFFGSLWLFALLMFSSYSATLVSYLTISRFSVPFNSIDELSHNLNYGIFMMSDSQQLKMITESQSDVYHHLWRRIFKQKSNTTVDSMFEALDKVSRGKYVFLYDDKSLLYATRNTCDLVVSNALTKPYQIALAFQKGSNYKDAFDKVLRTLNDAGILVHLKEKWWGNRLLCSQDAHVFVTLPLTNVATGFLILLTGFLGCFLIICIEYIFVSRSKPMVKKSYESDSETYWRHLKFPKHARHINPVFDFSRALQQT